jgi:hypothetical protein
MVECVLRKWPQCAVTRWLASGGFWKRPLEAVVSMRDASLTRVVLEVSGGALIYGWKKEFCNGIMEHTFPTLYFSLLFPCAEILRMLVDAGALSLHRYDAWALEQLAIVRAVFVACSFPIKPKFHKEYASMLRKPDEIRKTVDLILSASLPSFAGSQKNNPVLFTLIKNTEYIMEEKHAVTYLCKCRDAGLDILHYKESDVASPHVSTLVHSAAAAGLLGVMDIAIGVAGPSSVDGWSEEVSAVMRTTRVTPLLFALEQKQTAVALHLLRHHKARAASREAASKTAEQPVMVLLAHTDDKEGLVILKELIKADPLLLDLPCYSPIDATSPIACCLARELPRCLEFLLTSGLKGLQTMCRRAHRSKTVGDPTQKADINLAQHVASMRAWENLSILLRHCPDISVLAPATFWRPDGTWFHDSENAVIKLVKNLGAPRAVLLQVEAIARRQTAEEQKAKVIAANSAVPSNAFEEPGPKVVTEAEEKRKAKKRAAKKKAKQKKRAAAAAAKEGNAGAGKEAEAAVESDSSDSSGSDEEEAGMTEEERMLARAPTFDLEKERAARKARAELEAAEKGKERKE